MTAIRTSGARSGPVFLNDARLGRRIEVDPVHFAREADRRRALARFGSAGRGVTLPQPGKPFHGGVCDAGHG